MIKAGLLDLPPITEPKGKLTDQEEEKQEEEEEEREMALNNRNHGGNAWPTDWNSVT